MEENDYVYIDTMSVGKKPHEDEMSKAYWEVIEAVVKEILNEKENKKV